MTVLGQTAGHTYAKDWQFKNHTHLACWNMTIYIAAVQVEKTDAQLRKAVAAHRAAEGEVEGKRKLQAAAQKQALQLDKKAGRQQKDVESQVAPVFAAGAFKSPCRKSLMLIFVNGCLMMYMHGVWCMVHSDILKTIA